MPTQDEDNSKPQRSLLRAAFKGSVKAVSTARKPVRKIRGGLKTMIRGVSGVSRFVRSNSLKGLIAGELVISQTDLQKWFSGVEPPQDVSNMSLTCRPSRLVLALRYERRLFGIRVAKTRVDLPFDILRVDFGYDGGVIRFRLDREGVKEPRGVLQHVFIRLLSSAASDLLDERSQLTTINRFSDIIQRDGDIFTIDVGQYPPFLEVMNREVRLIGGHSLFPFRAIRVVGVQVEEGQLVVQTKLERDFFQRSAKFDELEDFDGEDDVEIEIVESQDE